MLWLIIKYFIYRLNSYTMHSRNLLRSQDRDGRRRHLKTGRLQVVSFLNDLPKTQHDPLSFTVDLTIFTVNKTITYFL